MKPRLLCALCGLLFPLLCSSAGPGIYSRTVFYGDVSVGSWAAMTNLRSYCTSGGAYTNGAVTNYYRLSATNRLGRLPLSTNVIVVCPGVTNGSGTNAIALTWARYDGISSYVIEVSTNAGTYWSNWLTLGPSYTNWTDTGTNGWTNSIFTNAHTTLIASPSVPWSGVGADNLGDHLLVSNLVGNGHSITGVLEVQAGTGTFGKVSIGSGALHFPDASYGEQLIVDGSVRDGNIHSFASTMYVDDREDVVTNMLAGKLPVATNTPSAGQIPYATDTSGTNWHWGDAPSGGGDPTNTVWDVPLVPYAMTDGSTTNNRITRAGDELFFTSATNTRSYLAVKTWVTSPRQTCYQHGYMVIPYGCNAATNVRWWVNGSDTTCTNYLTLYSLSGAAFTCTGVVASATADQPKNRRTSDTFLSANWQTHILGWRAEWRMTKGTNGIRAFVRFSE